ncbi:respiratory nitrate reductase subunit gamma [Paenibacillus larvae]
MNAAEQVLWLIYPYVVLCIFLIGLYYRFQTDQFGWTSKSSEILEKKQLKWGSNLFHIGIIFVFFGHVAGLLIPKSFYEFLGITDNMYHSVVFWGGSLAGLMTVAGIFILVYRRFANRRVRRTSSIGDMVALLLLTLILLTGLTATFSNAGHTDFDYRTTINPWIRGVLTFHPDASLMRDVPVLFKLHVLIGLSLFAVFPFTRLVHIISMPITYLRRSYVLYRKRR